MFYLADKVCVLPNKAQLCIFTLQQRCILPCEATASHNAHETVIPGPDQGSYFNVRTNACDTKKHPTNNHHQIPGPGQE